MCVCVCVGEGGKGGGGEGKVVEIKIENKNEQFQLKGFNFLTIILKCIPTHIGTWFFHFSTHIHTHNIYYYNVQVATNN